MKRAWLLACLVGCANPTTDIEWLVTGTQPEVVSVKTGDEWSLPYSRETADGRVYVLPRPLQGDASG